MRWQNWSTSESCKPESIHFARTLEDAQAVVAHSATAGRTVRVAGSGHSHYRLVPNDGVILDMSGITGLISVDTANSTARIHGGTTIFALGRQLLEHGLALYNQGDIDRQAIAGVVATGTHGTGRGLGNFSAAVRSMKVIDPSGELVELSPNSNLDTFQAARLNLGAFGVVAEVELAVRSAYRLSDHVVMRDYADARASIGPALEQHRHAEFFWYPQSDEAMFKTIDETDQEPVYPVADEGSRTAWSFEVLPSHRPHLHTEMEVAVPVAESLDCLDEIRSMVRSQFPELMWPIEYRTVAADDVWLSQAYEREVATISLHQGIGQPAEPVFGAAGEIFARYGGRPHWGKVHYLDGEGLARVHPRWNDWWQRRDAFDPDGVFLNDRMRSWRT
ncbi:MAG: D-arabinono-1,4-lactone oxidase [Acidimicrobiales bacterium]|nr:FAD-binding protein [Acidimicrobiales bacterium]